MTTTKRDQFDRSVLRSLTFRAKGFAMREIAEKLNLTVSSPSTGVPQVTAATGSRIRKALKRLRDAELVNIEGEKSTTRYRRLRQPK